jgi:hypothetical protein
VLLLLVLISVQMEPISDQFVTLTNFFSLEYLIVNKTKLEQVTQLAPNGILPMLNLDGLSMVFSLKEQMDLISIPSI